MAEEKSSENKIRTALAEKIALAIFLVALGSLAWHYIAHKPDTLITLDAKLSHDGTRLGVVRYSSSGALMKIAHLNEIPVKWIEVEIPKLTKSFNFGNRNDEILIVYGENHEDKPYTMHLAGVPLNRADKSLRKYSSSDVLLAFPEQLDDGSILVLSGLYRTEGGRIPEKIWQLLRPGQTPQNIGDPFLGYGGYPKILGSGFYSVEPTYPPGKGAKLHQWALPGGNLPDLARYLSYPYTSGLVCTRNGHFCLRQYTFEGDSERPGLRNTLGALSHGKECQLLELPRWIDRLDVAADARVAILIAADQPDAPRKLLLLKFANDSCQLISRTELGSDNN